jgi:hypothetical protein
MKSLVPHLKLCYIFLLLTQLLIENKDRAWVIETRKALLSVL